jgi:hypothetical protein
MGDTWNYPENCPDCGGPMQRIERIIEIRENEHSQKKKSSYDAKGEICS